ncbi:hypothetical protein AAG570_003978 [Ranatra chinensis]|uniref:RING-type domain-containing protein n=1 Tax=Ranatra chinensis TaxID=642074 RepID=A0ABD0YF18_9HEMI
MQTSPCGHRVVCRKCFVKTIQMAVSQRLLPLRCVICRAKILRLKQTGLLASSQSSWSVPNSESLYSMSSGSSSISAASSTSTGSSCTGKCGSSRNYLRQPTGSFRKSQAQSMKYHLQEYKEPQESEKPMRLPPIQEFQREFRLGKERSSSTRIRCAQKIITQLETTPPISSKSTSSYFRPPLKPANIENDKKRNSRDTQIKQKCNKEDKRKVDTYDKPKKSERQERIKSEKRDKSKDEKKELSKAEKKEQKKEGKAEKKNAKKEAKNEKKDKKE